MSTSTHTPALTYVPIANSQAPELTDVVISLASTPFTAAPPLGYLSAYQEEITATSTYYNPLRPSLSQTTPVSYLIHQTITTLASSPLALRHKGETVDMEISLDTYSYIQANPIIAPYSTTPQLSPLQDAESYYQRLSTRYIYANVPVPPASAKLWDGRARICVNLAGEQLSSTSQVSNLQQKVLAILNSTTLTPLSVVSVGGLATTRKLPALDSYAANYKVILQDFVAIHYTSTAIPPQPESLPAQQITHYIPVTDSALSSGTYTLTLSTTAALLDETYASYFVSWVNYLVYTEIPNPHVQPSLTLEDTKCLLLGYDADNHSIVSIPAFTPINPLNWYLDNLSLLSNDSYLE